jgi:hypothetical protein
MAIGTQSASGRSTTIAIAWRTMIHSLRHPYRPERHYMRGPGPAWQAKYAAGTPG